MPNIWTAVDANFPTVSPEEDPQQQIQKLLNYMYVLQEQLKYTLNNLDQTNWNGTALTNYSAQTNAPVQQQQTSLEKRIAELQKSIDQVNLRCDAIMSIIETIQS